MAGAARRRSRGCEMMWAAGAAGAGGGASRTVGDAGGGGGGRRGWLRTQHISLRGVALGRV